MQPGGDQLVDSPLAERLRALGDFTVSAARKERCVAEFSQSLAESRVLWHLKVSHYNEKARWALDYKRLPHVRRAAVPGRHHKIAEELTGGSTFPVLVLDGEAIGDSTRIIEALERRCPDP